MWGGRFTSAASDSLSALSVSTHFDVVLLPYDIAQSRAHVRELLRCGYLSQEQAHALDDALAAIAQEYAAGLWLPHSTDEDIHSAIERTLVERLGADLGGRIRTGRSRNDQVATDFRLYLRDAAAHIARAVADLAEAIANKADAHVNDLCAGFTHLQHAQPVTFGHEIGKHVWPLVRDLQRLNDWRQRNDVSPMGAGALAGSSLGLDPQRVAADLGFSDVARNSIDAVSDRDFVAEFCFVTALLGVHLSRLGEEVCVWATPEFGWVRLHDSWSTGSSLMPQKRNPDIAELARGKSGRLMGSLVTVLTMLKGLPFGYNRDQQEDKEATIDSVETLLLVLPAMTGLVETLTIDTTRLAASLTQGHSTATDLAEWLAGLTSAHCRKRNCLRWMPD
ncbi:MAG: argininosuccinate lyase [Actinobacteria bacterium]|nr:argininosuccinate lyase [Actinomycetota bacterium]